MKRKKPTWGRQLARSGSFPIGNHPSSAVKLPSIIFCYLYSVYPINNVLPLEQRLRHKSTPLSDRWTIPIKRIRNHDQDSAETTEDRQSISNAHILIKWNGDLNESPGDGVSNESDTCQCTGCIDLVRIHEILVCGHEDTQNAETKQYRC